MHVVATAGHVDHGKSTLVKALTGTDPDRWAEEKARGLTIDLGFAHTTLPSGRPVAFIDVPGHVRFLRNMLAGVGAVDACLFVVAATEGWKPQSEEHLRILELLGVRHGLVALTMAGLVDGDGLELARMELADRLAGTFLDGAPVVAVDAPTGRGADDLVAALDAVLAATPIATDLGRPRLWIDRSFAAKGSGTVVTGTLTGGTLRVGDELLLAPRARRVRVRGLQSHDASLDEAGPGRRLAVNLSGVTHTEVHRGDALVKEGQWHFTNRIDASLTALPGLGHDVSRRGAYQAYFGSGEGTVEVRVLGAETIKPGTTGLVRLLLRAALPFVPGDRYILREAGRGETIGGGEILDIAPVLPAAKARPDRSVARVVRERGWVEADDLERMTGVRTPPVIGNWVVDPDALAAATERLRARIEAAGPLGLDQAELTDRERAVLATLDALDARAGRVRPVQAADPLAGHPFVAALEASPFSPPPPDGVDRGELRELVRRGLVIERDGIHFAPAAVDEAARRVAALLAVDPEGVTVGQVRDTLGTSRKFLLPLLNLLDSQGVTRRRGDVRVAGPRIPKVDD